MTRVPARFEDYETRLGREVMIGRGSAEGPPLLVFQPLFEEGNFTRSFAADLIDALAECGFLGWLFDLPGLGDSLVPLRMVELPDWRDAAAEAGARIAALTGQRPHVVSIRGGALLDDAIDARSCWRLAPATGASMVRTMARAGALGDSDGLAGWPVGETLRTQLVAAAPIAPPCPMHAISWPNGTPPWRRAEPARDPAVSAALATEIAAWIAACAGR